jgi:hypothetical protein
MAMNQQRSRIRRESEHGSEVGRPERMPFDDLVEYARDYARERPQTAALICLGVGFILGWKLKPW